MIACPVTPVCRRPRWTQRSRLTPSSPLLHMPCSSPEVLDNPRGVVLVALDPVGDDDEAANVAFWVQLPAVW